MNRYGQETIVRPGISRFVVTARLRNYRRCKSCDWIN